MQINLCLLAILLYRSVVNSPSSILSIKELACNGLYKKLVDFDCHLESINDDWTNPAINKAIVS